MLTEFGIHHRLESCDPSDLGPNYRNSGAFSDGGGDELNTITSDIAAAMGGSGAGGGGTVSPTNLVSAVDGRQVWAIIFC